MTVIVSSIRSSVKILPYFKRLSQIERIWMKITRIHSTVNVIYRRSFYFLKFQDCRFSLSFFLLSVVRLIIFSVPIQNQLTTTDFNLVRLLLSSSCSLSIVLALPTLFARTKKMRSLLLAQALKMCSVHCKRKLRVKYQYSEPITHL